MSWTLTVTDLNDYVRRSLAGDPILQDVSLRGEISNFKRHISGHLYFSLKDEQARIECVMFRQYAYLMDFEPQNGMQVVLKGAVSLYVASGSYQFYATSMKPDGLGDLHIRFEQLKNRLMAEGLFDQSLKKPLPLLPQRVGIVTAKTGAVVHDIARVAGRRNPGVQFVLRPAKVQGDGAAQDIAQGIRDLEKWGSVDVIIIGRGGGSLEDLWAFNEECVVRAIYECSIPIVSAVGHEVDVTLSDFAADVRAATPSAAAELVVQNKSTLQDMVRLLSGRLLKAAADKIALENSAIRLMEKRLALLHPLVRLRDIAMEGKTLAQRNEHAMEKKLQTLRLRLNAAQNRLSALSPERVLERGYAIVMKDDTPVLSAGDARGDMTLVFKDGQVPVVTKEGAENGGKAEYI